jgi:hypothetical protein
MTENISEAGSIKGYSFKKWLKGTKESAKTLFTAGVAIGTYFIAKAALDPALAAVLTAFVMAFSKWAIDALDFWLSDVKL